MLDELLPLAAERAGGLAWEYYFSFGGGRPPWVSGLAQGTAVQALARSATPAAAARPTCCRSPSGRWRSSRRRRRRACACRPSTATTTRSTRSLPTCGCSTASSSRSIGLHDYARLSGDPRGTALFEAAEPQARARGAAVRHRRLVAVLARQLDPRVQPQLPRPARRASSRTCASGPRREVYCTTAENFVAYKSQPPAVVVTPKRLRGGKPGRVRLRALEDLQRDADDHARRRRSSSRGRSAPSATASAPSAGTSRAGAATTRCSSTSATWPATPASAQAVVTVLKPKRKKRP